MRASTGMGESAGKQIRQSVQRYVGNQWRTNCTLGCALRRTEELFVLNIACLQPRLNLPTSREVPESLIDVDMADAVKCAADISVQNPSGGRPAVEPVEAGGDSVMGAASGAESVAGSFEMRLPGGFQRRFDHMLANAVLDGGDA